MKRFFCFFLIASFLGLEGYAKGPVAEGKTHCCLGNYVIDQAVNPVSINGKDLKTYIVNYENSDLNVRIGIDKSDKRCTKYIVVSDNLSIMYICNNKYFGVQRLGKEYVKDGLSTSDLSLDRQEYYHQRVISNSVRSDIDHLKLISVYFPRLVKNFETVFAFR